MGGLLILSALTSPRCSGPICATRYVWVVLFVTLGYGALGFADDYLQDDARQPQGPARRARS